MNLVIDYDLFDEIILDNTKLDGLASNLIPHLLLYTQDENKIFESLLSHLAPEKLSIDNWLKLDSHEKILPYLAKIYTSNSENPDLEILKKLVTKYSCFFKSKYGNEAFVLAQKIYRNFEKFSNWPILLGLIQPDSKPELFSYVYYTAIPHLLNQQRLFLNDFDISQLSQLDWFFLQKSSRDVRISTGWFVDLYIALIKNPQTYWKIFDEHLNQIENFKTYQAKIANSTIEFKTNFNNNWVLNFFINIFNNTPHGFEDCIKMCNKFFNYDTYNTNNLKKLSKSSDLSADTTTYIDKIKFENLNGCSSLKLDTYKPIYDYLLTKDTPNLAKTVKETCRNFITI